MDLLKQIESWNIKFPFDYIWRRKYNIPFNSEVHRNMDFFHIKFDIEEERMFKRISVEKYNEEVISKREAEFEELNPSARYQLLKSVRSVDKLSKEDIDEYFENMELDSFDEKITI